MRSNDDFLIAQARAQAEEIGIPPYRVRWTPSQLAQADWVARIKQGVYVAQAPLFSTEIHPYAIAAALVEPATISHWSALAHHGLTTQIPPMIQASTPSTVVTPRCGRDGPTVPEGARSGGHWGWNLSSSG